MATNVGDLVYRVRVDTKGLTAATKKVNQFSRSLKSAALQAQKLNRNLTSSYSKVGAVVTKTSSTASKAANASAMAAIRQEKAVHSLRNQYTKLNEGFRKIGAQGSQPMATLASQISSLDRKLQRGVISSEEFAARQLKIQKSMDAQRTSLRGLNSSYQSQVRNIKMLSTASEQLNNLNSRAQAVQSAGGFAKQPKELALAMQNANKAFKEYDSAIQSANGNTKKIAQAQAAFNRSMGKSTRTIKQFETGLKSAGGPLRAFADGIKSVGTAFAAFLIFQTAQAAIGGFFRTLDQTKEVRARLSLVSDSVGEVNDKMSRLREIADRTRQPLGDTAELYAKVAFSAKALGIEQEKLFGLVEGFNAGLVVSGASAQEAAGSIRQFTQALASGRLQGDEFRSVLENNRAWAAALADALDVTIGGLFKMREAGTLTAEKIVEVSDKIRDNLIKNLEKMPITAGQSITLMNNKIFVMIDNLNELADVTGGIVSVLSAFSKHLEELVIIIATLVGTQLPRLVFFIGGSLVKALKTATIAVVTMGTAMAATPIGAMIAALRGLATLVSATFFGGAAAAVVFQDEMVEVGTESVRAGSLIQATFIELGNLLRAYFDRVSETFQAVVDWSKKAVELIGTIWAKLTAILLFPFAEFSQKVGELLLGTVDKLLFVSDETKKSIKDVAKTLIDFGDFDKREAKIRGLFKGIGDTAIRTGKDLKDSFLGSQFAQNIIARAKAIDDALKKQNETRKNNNKLSGEGEELTKKQIAAYKKMAETINEVQIRFQQLNAQQKLANTGTLDQLLDLQKQQEATNKIREFSNELKELTEGQLRKLSEQFNLATSSGAGFNQLVAEIATQLANMEMSSDSARERISEMTQATENLNEEFPGIVQSIKDMQAQVAAFQSGGQNALDEIINAQRIRDAGEQWAELAKNVMPEEALSRLNQLQTMFPAILAGMSQTGSETERLAEALRLVGEHMAGLQDNLVDPVEDRIRQLENETNAIAGVERGILKLQQSYSDFASQAENVVTNAFQSMEDALVKFVETGKLDFKELASSIVSDIVRMTIRMKILLPLMQQLGGGVGGGGGIIGTALGFLFPGMANGGFVSPSSPYIVGEEGPEVFVPQSAGRIVPNGESSMNLNQNLTFNIQGDNISRNTIDQIRANVGVATQRALARNR